MREDLLNKLAYFDVFKFPLKKEEIHRLLKTSYTEKELDELLSELVREGAISKNGEFYSISPEPEFIIRKRKEHEKVAEKYLRKAPTVAKLMKRFPFVRGIAISGSLSKGVIHPKGDIDYFIITKPGRLWISRTLLILFKKLFLLNSRKYFCVNYFVDTNHLNITDKNLFVATEIVFLLPIYNHRLFRDMQEQNEWINEYYSHFEHPISMQDSKKSSWVRSIFEFLLNGKIGDALESRCKKMTLKRWHKKFSHFDRDKFELTMRSTDGISKHHPQDFQNQVLSELNNRKKKLGIA